MAFLSGGEESRSWQPPFPGPMGKLPWEGEGGPGGLQVWKGRCHEGGRDDRVMWKHHLMKRLLVAWGSS